MTMIKVIVRAALVTGVLVFMVWAQLGVGLFD